MKSLKHMRQARTWDPALAPGQTSPQPTEFKENIRD